ncbi:hypothetical protein K501DRAFT_332473 [Backusella circina FSU 941]|nr:hypothetical protein K501DRAFT_332473 [Backusella circina FSU 941]
MVGYRGTTVSFKLSLLKTVEFILNLTGGLITDYVQLSNVTAGLYAIAVLVCGVREEVYFTIINGLSAPWIQKMNKGHSKFLYLQKVAFTQIIRTWAEHQRQVTPGMRKMNIKRLVCGENRERRENKIRPFTETSEHQTVSVLKYVYVSYLIYPIFYRINYLDFRVILLQNKHTFISYNKSITLSSSRSVRRLSLYMRF